MSLHSYSDINLFTEKPCIPAMYLIHEQKFTKTHQVLFQEVICHIPSLKTTKSCMVTNKERAITKAIELEVPDLKMVQCWNHLFRDTCFWLRKRGAPTADITIYIDDMSQLFHSLSEEAYNQLLEQCCESGMLHLNSIIGMRYIQLFLSRSVGGCLNKSTCTIHTVASPTTSLKVTIRWWRIFSLGKKLHWTYCFVSAAGVLLQWNQERACRYFLSTLCYYWL